jgi:transcriptional regulator with XRE-family HTH domain
MRPDASLHNPDPKYLRGLIESAGLSISETARLIGMTRNGLRNYLRDRSEPLSRTADYRVQFALECLANQIENSSEGTR